MTDLSQYSDAELAQFAGIPFKPVDKAIVGQESGNNPNAPTSVNGAVGESQILPETFARFAKPGEDIHNTNDNIAVGQRYRDYLAQRFNNDPARIAVGYFSGEGNVAPANSPTPWIHDTHDGYGKKVSSYVSDVLGRMGNTIVSDANASENTDQNRERIGQGGGDAAPLSTAPGNSDMEPSTASTTDIHNGSTGDQRVSVSGGSVTKGNADVANQPDFSQYSDDELMRAAGITPEDTGSDIAKTAAAVISRGIARQTVDPLFIPKQAAEFGAESITRPLGAAYEYAADKLGLPPMSQGVARFMTYPTVDPNSNTEKTKDILAGEVIPAAVKSATGADMNYQPQTFGGKATQAGLQLAPYMMGGEEAIPTQIARVAGSGAGGEFAGEAAKELGFGEKGQQVAKTIGTMGGAFTPEAAKAIYNAKDVGTGLPNIIGNTSGTSPGLDNAITKPIQNIFPKSSEPTPPSLLKTDSGKPVLVAPQAIKQGANDLGTFLQADGINLNKVADDLEKAQKIDPNARAIDVMAKEEGGLPSASNILGLAKSIAQSPGQGRALAAEMTSRGYNATQDIGNSFEKALSGSDYYKTQADAIQQQEGSGRFYKSAFSHPENQNISDPVINKILETPAGKNALRIASVKMLNDAPIGGGEAGEGGEISYADYLNAKQLLATQNAASPPVSLTSFIQRNGGIKDMGGELRQFGLEPKLRPTFINKNGSPADSMAVKAWEAGYFPEHGEPPDVNTFLDAIRDDHNGIPRYREQDYGALDDIDARKNADQLINQYSHLYETPSGAASQGLSLKKLDYVKRAYDDQIEGATRDDARILRNKKNQLIAAMDRADATGGDYARGRKTYSTAARIKDAADNGRNFMNMSPDEIAQYFQDKGIPDPEKKAFAQGAGQAMQDRFDSVRDGSNPIQAIWKENLRKRLQPMLKDSSYKELADAMDLHQAKARVDKIMQGSPTYANEAFSKQPEAGAVGKTLRFIGNAMEPGMLVGKLGDIADKALQKQAATMSTDSKAIAMRYLTTKDPELLRYLARQTGEKAPENVTKH